METWLGIAILVLFSLGLNLFMRLEPRERHRELPDHLGRWVREDATPAAETYTERRALLVAGGLVRKTRLIEQRRIRRTSDGEIIEVLPERLLAAWR